MKAEMSNKVFYLYQLEHYEQSTEDKTLYNPILTISYQRQRRVEPWGIRASAPSEYAPDEIKNSIVSVPDE